MGALFAFLRDNWEPTTGGIIFAVSGIIIFRWLFRLRSQVEAISERVAKAEGQLVRRREERDD